jgi:hypothetical protein
MDIEWYRYLASLRDKKEPEQLAAVHNLSDARKHEHDEMPQEDRKAS